MAEILHTFENGRIIYKRPTSRNSIGIKEARQLEQNYIDAGYPKGLKPYFMDGSGELWEIEPKGLGKQSKDNPKGLGFGNLNLHRTRSSTYRANKAGAAFNAKRFFTNFRKFPEFKDVSDADLWDFSEKVDSMNKEELRIQQRNKLPGEHSDHRVSLKDRGLELRNNKENIQAQDNLTKGSSSVDIETQKRIGSFAGDEEASVRGALRSPLPKGNGKKIDIVKDTAIANRNNLPSVLSVPLTAANCYEKLLEWRKDPTTQNAVLLGLASVETIADVGGGALPILEVLSQVAGRAGSAIEMGNQLKTLSMTNLKRQMHPLVGRFG